MDVLRPWPIFEDEIRIFFRFLNFAVFFHMYLCAISKCHSLRERRRLSTSLPAWKVFQTALDSEFRACPAGLRELQVSGDVAVRFSALALQTDQFHEG